ncbi:hypothetical protein H632_c385p1 [Helicosporidium sp. ATCC 50920]|nr:hypothetical protein H632_c385p1 [Helicosporidium sp. ATCC 50920]|eukprot:KDD76038.1 hypothetical protein H632_c385p1 [Helicosporidium sp. ATCC 50920]
MSLATPHVGCGQELDYTQPAVSKTLMKLLGTRLYLQACDWMFRKSAKQLNWRDGDGDVKPLIWRLACDDATEARLPSAKAPAAAKRVVGVFLEDPLENAWAPGMRPAALRGDPESAKPRVVTVSQDRGDAAAGGEIAEEAGEALGETMPVEARQELSKADKTVPDASAPSAAESLPSPHVEAAMTKLRTLDWRRIDVSFKGVALASLAHNHIMMQHAFFNRVGRSVVKHVAEQFKVMEAAREASAS